MSSVHLSLFRGAPHFLLALLHILLFGSLSATSTPPVSQFEVYQSTDCTGPLFQLDTNWQWFTSLTESQMTFRSILVADANATTPCAPYPVSFVPSAELTCFDDGVFTGLGMQGWYGAGYSAAGCAANNRYRAWSYNAIGNNITGPGCQKGVVNCANCTSVGTAVGYKIQCAIPRVPNDATAHTSSVYLAVMTCLVAMTMAGMLF